MAGGESAASCEDRWQTHLPSGAMPGRGRRGISSERGGAESATADGGANLHERDLVDSALRHHDVPAIVGRLDVANNAAAAGNNPALELARPDVEADEHVRFDRRFDVPDRA